MSNKQQVPTKAVYLMALLLCIYTSSVQSKDYSTPSGNFTFSIVANESNFDGVFSFKFKA